MKLSELQVLRDRRGARRGIREMEAVLLVEGVGGKPELHRPVDGSARRASFSGMSWSKVSGEQLIGAEEDAWTALVSQ